MSNEKYLTLLARFDEIDQIEKSLYNIFNKCDVKIHTQETTRAIICVVSIEFSEEISTRSIRNLNVIPVSEKTADWLLGRFNGRSGLPELNLRMTSIGKREQFDYLKILFHENPVLRDL
jgi:hypothetical protein